MECSQCREALSALVDGEDLGVPAVAVRGHVTSCPGCRAWEQDLWLNAASLRVAGADVVPDLSGAILHRSPELRAPRRWLEAVRGALLLVAGVQLAIASTSVMSSSTHAAREQGAWEAAFAIGLLVVVIRPRGTAGLLPIAGAVGAVLLIAGAVDVTRDRTTLASESEHLVLLVALVLLVMLHWRTRTTALW